ncbi:MAG: putative Thiol protease aleurain [Streblomastix strix]|uniref:Putative Thiol protease aleurain n=1 Tax=Streblomastix strix TaxID=222440 RepID=A0A5J4VIM9_9EUKA|nr:MAG: putative Thiol protease aleurain [Streblomastix strix]
MMLIALIICCLLAQNIVIASILEKKSYINTLKAAEMNLHGACSSLRNFEDQGSCGASWAISSTGAYADTLCIKKGINIVPSAQWQLNCDKSCPPHPFQTICNDGCKGATLYMAATWIGEYGIVSKECVPFQARDGKCYLQCGNGVQSDILVQDMRHDVENNQYKIDNTSLHSNNSIPSNIEFKLYSHLCAASTKEKGIQAMKWALQKYGSLLSGMDVYHNFLNYKGGIYTQQQGLNLGFQAVRIVGWGTDSVEGDYWIVHNSFGSNWGENGRSRVAAGNNLCGLEQEFYFFIPCEDLDIY